MDLTEDDEQSVLSVVHRLPLNFLQQLDLRDDAVDDNDDDVDLRCVPHEEWRLVDVVRASRRDQDAAVWASHMKWRRQKERVHKQVMFLACLMALFAVSVNENTGDAQIDELD
jgi:hypothetical protein